MLTRYVCSTATLQQTEIKRVIDGTFSRFEDTGYGCKDKGLLYLDGSFYKFPFREGFPFFALFNFK